MIKDLTSNRFKFYKELKTAGIAMFLLGILASLATFFISGELIHLVTGKVLFEGSIRALNILSLGFPAFFLSSLLMWVLVVHKRYYSLLLIYFTGLVINISLNLIFIPTRSY